MPIHRQPQSLTLAAIALAAALSACGPDASAPASAGARAGGAGPEGAYREPPALVSAARTPTGRVLLTGHGRGGSRVRLRAADGQLIIAQADRAGSWRVLLPPADHLRVIGLSQDDGGRTLQAEGYLAVTPEGVVALLRPGSGARAWVGGGETPRVLAIDYDRQGGAVISGLARPSGTVGVSVDGVARGALRASADGRFMLALNEPLAAGDHRLEVVEGAGAWRGDVAVLPPPPLGAQAFRAARAGPAWRVDWATPVGGLQTTLLFLGPERTR